MENDKLARALAVGTADSVILGTCIAELIRRHPEREAIVRTVEQHIAEQMIESARADHYPHFREELRTRWQLFRHQVDIE